MSYDVTVMTPVEKMTRCRFRCYFRRRPPDRSTIYTRNVDPI